MEYQDRMMKLRRTQKRYALLGFLFSILVGIFGTVSNDPSLKPICWIVAVIGGIFFCFDFYLQNIRLNLIITDKYVILSSLSPYGIFFKKRQLHRFDKTNIQTVVILDNNISIKSKKGMVYFIEQKDVDDIRKCIEAMHVFVEKSGVKDIIGEFRKMAQKRQNE